MSAEVSGEKGAESASKEKVRRWQNPYKLRLAEFPGRLFTFNSDFEKDTAEVRSLAKDGGFTLCEIGSGSGAHMLELAQKNPGARVFGFEIRYKRAVRTIEKAQRDNIPNAYVLRIKGEAIAEIFPERSVRGVYVNFPEPWDKLKRQKHRVLNTAFLQRMEQVLQQDGFISIKTDHPSYFASFREDVIEHAGFRIEAESNDLYASPYAADNIPTEFERLFRYQQLPIHFLYLRQKSTS